MRNVKYLMCEKLRQDISLSV